MQSFSVKKLLKISQILWWILVYGIRKHYLDITEVSQLLK